MNDIPADLRDLYFNPPPPRSGDAQQEVAWLRLKARSTALDDAVHAALDVPDDVLPPYAETMALILDMVRRLDWPADRANAALKAEWAAAQLKVREVVDTVERRVRALAYERVPGDRMLAEAMTLADQPPVFIPEPLIVALCQRIAQSTVRMGHARRGR